LGDLDVNGKIIPFLLTDVRGYRLEELMLYSL